MTELTSAPAHVSYSQLSSWVRCGKAYELERVLHVPSSPTWAQVAGNAVHTATEQMDRGDAGSTRDLWQDVFTETIEAAEERHGVARTEWRATGRKTKAAPNGEDARWWWFEGVEMLNRWKTWRNVNKDKWQIVNLKGPGSELWEGIELPLNIRFGDIAVQGVVDRLFADEHGQMIVVDLKSGSWAPKDAGQQLGLYATGIEQVFGIRPVKGAYWMARTGEFSAPEMDLDHFSNHYWTQAVTSFAKAKAEKIYLPNPGMFCGSCSVRDYCATVGGRLAHLADSLSVDS